MIPWPRVIHGRARASLVEATLRGRSKLAELAKLEQDTPAAGATSFTRQQEPLGLGHAVWCARDIVGDEPFALLLPDMLHFGAKPYLKEMIEAYEAEGGNHIGVYPVADDERINTASSMSRGRRPRSPR